MPSRRGRATVQNWLQRVDAAAEHPKDGFNALRLSVAMLGRPAEGAGDDVDGRAGAGNDIAVGDMVKAAPGEEHPVLLQPLELCFHGDFKPDPMEPVSLHFHSDGAIVKYHPPPDLQSPRPPCYLCEGGIIELFPRPPRPPTRAPRWFAVLWKAVVFGFPALLLVLSIVSALLCGRYAPAGRPTFVRAIAPTVTPVVEVVVRELPLHSKLVSVSDTALRLSGSLRTVSRPSSWGESPQMQSRLDHLYQGYTGVYQPLLQVAEVIQSLADAVMKHVSEESGPRSREWQLAFSLYDTTYTHAKFAARYWLAFNSTMARGGASDGEASLRHAVASFPRQDVDSDPRVSRFFTQSDTTGNGGAARRRHHGIDTASPSVLPEDVDDILEAMETFVDGVFIRDICELCNQTALPPTRPANRDESGRPVRRGPKKSTPHASSWHPACQPPLANATAAERLKSLVDWGRARRARRVARFLSDGHLLDDEEWADERGMLMGDGEITLQAVTRHLAELVSSIDDLIALASELGLAHAPSAVSPLREWSTRAPWSRQGGSPHLSKEERRQAALDVADLQALRDGRVVAHLAAAGAAMTKWMNNCQVAEEARLQLLQLRKGQGWVSSETSDLSIDDAGHAHVTVTHTQWVFARPTTVAAMAQEALDRFRGISKELVVVPT